MGQWIKFFADGTRYVGEDRAIQKKQASWRLSRNNSIVKVTLEHQDCHLEITGPGEYWQSDQYEVTFPEQQPVLTARRIMRQLVLGDHWALLKQPQATILMASFHDTWPIHTTTCARALSLKDQVGTWCVLELDLTTGGQSPRMYFTKERL